MRSHARAVMLPSRRGPRIHLSLHELSVVANSAWKPDSQTWTRIPGQRCCAKCGLVTVDDITIGLCLEIRTMRA